MKFSKPNLYTLTAAVTLGAFSLSFTPAAMATSIYNAEASFSLTLDSVFNVNREVTSGWSVEAKGDDFGGSDLFKFGVASASGNTSVVNDPKPNPWVSLNIGSMITQTSTSSGSATNGFSWTDTLTDLDIKIRNESSEALTFSFFYDIIATATATGEEALASASIDMLDLNKFSFVDILAVAEADVEFGPTFDDASGSGIIEFTLQSGEFNKISGFIDTTGEAAAVSVPEPAVALLFAIGLLIMPGIARSKKAS